MSDTIDATRPTVAPVRPPVDLARFRPGYVLTVSILTIVGLLVAWQVAAALEVVPAMFLPSPEAVAHKLASTATDGFAGATLLQHIVASVWRVFAALVAATIFGTAVGFAINLNKTARGMIEPILEFYRPIPPLAYLPLVIIWFGIGEFAKILVIYLGIFPSIAIATNDALRSVSQDKVNAARSLGATRLQVVTLVLFPHALPSILTGIRIGLGTGWATLVAAELIAATQGLGFMIKAGADFLVTDVVVLGIVVIAIISIGMEFFLRLAQRVLVPWQGRE
jgi:taurine transport system permease protein